MTNLTDDQVKHVAKLAKLTLSEVEVKKFSSQLSKIIDHIEQLSKIDTTNIAPTSQTTGLINVFKDGDIVQTDRILTKPQVFLNTDKVHNNYFVASATINKDNI